MFAALLGCDIDFCSDNQAITFPWMLALDDWSEICFLHANKKRDTNSPATACNFSFIKEGLTGQIEFEFRILQCTIKIKKDLADQYPQGLPTF